MAEWTRDMVEDRVMEAAAVLKRLPGPQLRGYFSTWPTILLSAREIARQEPKVMKVLPSPQAITRMEEAITWNRYLEAEEANLMWARAEGTSWKEICYRFGISRPTATRRWEYSSFATPRAGTSPAAPPPAAGLTPPPPAAAPRRRRWPRRSPQHPPPTPPPTRPRCG